jgi:hypothetical protein
MKWIICSGCEDWKLVPRSARFCSVRCRNRVWRRKHGAEPGRRLQFCAWCNAPLLYMPQDRLPAVRRYCTDRCARKAWLAARAQTSMTSVGALEIAIHRLQKSRDPRVAAAASVLTELHRQLVDGVAPLRVDDAASRAACPNLPGASS